jgi:predicted RNase H-like nuclease (RuvC/YqgF family)
MNQYEKSGPAPDKVDAVQDEQAHAKLQRIETVLKQQEQQLQKLEQEVKRLKSKLDAHATKINKLISNG